MKQMTSAEFAKANLAAIDAPVEIRRYTTVMGTYYPHGYEPADAPQLALPAVDKKVAERVEELEEEVRRLKRELSAKALAWPALPPQQTSRDVFADLPKQDREFFERKLGTMRSRKK